MGPHQGLQLQARACDQGFCRPGSTSRAAGGKFRPQGLKHQGAAVADQQHGGIGAPQQGIDRRQGGKG